MPTLTLVIDLQWQSESPLHVGSGALADSLADKPVLKDTHGRPFVPGSAVRGKARHACEQVARGLPNWRWPNCLPPYQFCNELADPCPVCRLFGMETQRGRLRFTDLRLDFAPGVSVRDGRELLNRAGQTEMRWSVGLNRQRGTSEEDLLYNVETHSPNPALVYQGKVYGSLSDDATPPRGQAALLVAGLRAVRSLGGNHTRGLGWGRFSFTVRLGEETVAAETLAREVGGW
jgi:CRISPR/Cas system CSM-associated protein Csm3 (group 7 of RAMP superfamily)